MKKGAYVLIFFFWAFITIITPTLVQWSAAAAAAAGDSQSKDDPTGKGGTSSERLAISRKMMKLTQEIELQGMRKAPSRPRPPPALGVAVSLPPALAPNDIDRTKEESEVVALLGRVLPMVVYRLII